LQDNHNIIYLFMAATAQMILAFEATALVQECHHIQPSFGQAFAYSFGVATAFVASLYLLVPRRVRQLDRDNPVQIKWRSFATATVCVVAILVYPICFCSSSTTTTITTTTGSSVGKEPVLALMGLFIPRGLSLWHFWFGPLAHSILLYLGPITLLLLQAKIMVEASSTPTTISYLEAVRAVLFPTPFRIHSPTETQGQEERWVSWRSKVIAPVVEEIAFRGCILPPLVATALFHPHVVIWIAPLFFGLAHCHHATLMLRQGMPLDRVLQMTAFQFLYTTLFGAYAAHAFLRTGSLPAVILSHSFCNTMGLPSLSFLNDRRSALYQYRIDLIKAYLLGVAIFVWGFFDTTFLPLPLAAAAAFRL
jgi:prenyl protein peptidase